MSLRSDWSYAQARLQARSAERPGEGDWHALEALQSLERFLDHARSSSLARFTDRLSPEMTSHAIERVLRQEWRRYVEESARWTRPVWRPVVWWFALLPDLPILDRIRRGDVPDWADDDRFFAPAIGPQAVRLDPKQAPYAPLFEPGAADASLTERWLTRWRELCPAGPDRQALDELVVLGRAQAESLARGVVHEGSEPHRLRLAGSLVRLFRRRAGTPLAMFCHLALVALDLERLRGGLMRRRLFDAPMVRSGP